MYLPRLAMRERSQEQKVDEVMGRKTECYKRRERTRQIPQGRGGRGEGEKENALHEDLFILISPTVISAKLKLPKELSFASPSSHPLAPLPYFPFFRISCALHFGSASFSCQALLCLLPTNQPSSQELL